MQYCVSLKKSIGYLITATCCSLGSGLIGGGVEPVGGEMNVPSCLRWRSHLLFMENRNWAQSAQCVGYFLPMVAHSGADFDLNFFF